MGPLSVIAVWSCIAALFAAVAAALVWVGQHRQPQQVRRRRAAVAAALPISMSLWLLPAKVIWFGWSAASVFGTAFDGPVDALGWGVCWLLPPFVLARRWWIGDRLISNEAKK